MLARLARAAIALTAAMTAAQATAQTDPILSDKDFRNGRDACARESYDSAYVFFRKALDAYPKSAIGYNWLGYSQCNAGDLEEALQSYQRADKLVKRSDKDTKTSILEGLSTTYRLLDDYDKAISYADQLIETDDKVARYYSIHARLSEDINDKEAAIAYYQKATQLSPGSSSNQLSISRIYLWAGEYDKVIDIATKLIDINGRDADAYEARGWAYTLKGDYAKAVADLFDCINAFGRPYALATRLTVEAPSRMRWAWKSEMRGHPDAAFTWDLKGEIDFRVGDTQSAIKAAKESRSRALGYDICDILQSEEYFELHLGNWDRAERIAKANHRFDPTDCDYLTDLIDIAIERDRPGLDTLWTEIGRLRPNDLNYYGVICRSGDKDLLRRELPNIAKYVRLNPKEEDGYITKAMMHEIICEHAEAVECAEKALDIIDNKTEYLKVGYHDELETARLQPYAITGKTGAEADSLIARCLSHKIMRGETFSAAASLRARQGRNAEAIALVDSALHNGYFRVKWLERNPLLSSISGTSEFQALIKPYKERAERTDSTGFTPATKSVPYTTGSDHKPMVEGSVGTLKVDITLDEKREYASISNVESDFMIKNGIITNSDIYNVKDGSFVVIKDLKFGDVILPKVKLWIENQKAPITLDRKALCVAGMPKVDKEKKAIILTSLDD